MGKEGVSEEEMREGNGREDDEQGKEGDKKRNMA